MQTRVYPCTAVTPVNNFRLKKYIFKQQDDFNRVCWSQEFSSILHVNIYIYILYSPVNRNMQNCAYNGSIWREFVAVRKKTHKFSCWSGEDAGQTSRTWRKNVGLCFLVYARKHSDGLSKHCIRKFAIMCNITGVTIWRKFTQYIDLSFFCQKGHSCSKSHMEYQLFIKIYKRHCKLFHIILERRELTVCCDRTEIRNARNVLLLFFIHYLKWYFILTN